MTSQDKLYATPGSGFESRLWHRLQRGGAWIVGGRTGGMAIVFAIYVFLARVMPTQGFATYVLVASFVVFFSMAAMLGLNTLVCRYVSESFAVGDADRAQTAARLVARLGTASIVTSGCLAWAGVELLGDTLFGMPDLGESAGLVAVWAMLLAASQILAETFRGLHNLPLAGVLGGASGGLASNAVFLLSLIITSYFVPVVDFSTVALLAVGSLFLATSAAAIYLHCSWPRDPRRLRAASHDLSTLSARSVVQEALPVMLVHVFSFGLAQLDIWVVGACCSGPELTVYAVARRLSLLVAIPLTQISLVVTSSVSELYARSDRVQLQRVVKGASTISALATLIPVVAMLALAAPLLEFAFGGGFDSGAKLLRILLVGQLVFALTGPCGVALMMTGHQRMSLYSLLAAVPIYVLIPWVATTYGPSAVAIVFASALSLQNVTQWIVVRNVLGIQTQPSFSPRYIAGLFRTWDGNARVPLKGNA